MITSILSNLYDTLITLGTISPWIFNLCDIWWH